MRPLLIRRCHADEAPDDDLPCACSPLIHFPLPLQCSSLGSIEYPLNMKGEWGTTTNDLRDK